MRKAAKSFLAIEKLKFKIESADNFVLNGVSLKNKKSIKDFSLTDGAKLYQAFASKKLPFSFDLNVAVKNPNDGVAAPRKIDATITNLDWILLIDDRETIAGSVKKPIQVPARGKAAVIPFKMRLDLYKFFKDKNYDGLIKLAASIAGASDNPAKIKLKIRPTVSTPLGPINYGKYITVVSKEFR